MPRHSSNSSSSRSPDLPPNKPPKAVPAKIAALLGITPEQQSVVGPVVAGLVKKGWDLTQIVFGAQEWRVPKRPSEATKREKRHDYEGFPCDVAVFDSAKRRGDPQHLLMIIECKTPEEYAGVAQLESYLALEPHARLGVWVNDSDPTSAAVFISLSQRRSDRCAPASSSCCCVASPARKNP